MKQTLTFLILFSSSIGFAQNIDLDRFMEQRGVVNDNLYSLYNTDAEVRGTKYLFDDWQNGKMYFSSKLELKNILLNYHIETQTLEIEQDDEVKICPINLLESFILDDGRTFVNISQFANNARPAIAEVLYISGNLTLLERPKIEVTEPNYRATHDVGEKDIVINLKYDYVVVMDGKATQMAKKMKQNEMVFGESYETLLKYYKENKLNFKKRADLIKVIKHYDTILMSQPRP